MKKTLLLDGHSILFRAFYGVPPLTDSKGRPTNAVYGFLNILFKVLEEEKPDRIGAAFDLSRQQLRRTQLYADYKGNRKPMPEELKLQEGMLLDVLEAMGIPVWRIEGCEADDILGSMAKRMAAEGGDVSIVSGDRDLLQLCDEHITIVQPRTAKGRTETRRFGPDEVKEEFGVTPAEIIDLKALMGDASDNIPGLPGVGEKTAAAIIGAYHSIENALAHVEEVRPPRAQKAFLEHFIWPSFPKSWPPSIRTCLSRRGARRQTPQVFIPRRRWNSSVPMNSKAWRAVLRRSSQWRRPELRRLLQMQNCLP